MMSFCGAWLLLLVRGAVSAAPMAHKAGDGVDADSLRLDAQCKPCFPKNRKSCSKETWSNCCKQEVTCHDYHCRETVMGRLDTNMKVRIREDFVSDDDVKAELKKGMNGRVLRTDRNGDAYIKFFEDELDNEGSRHWVFKTTFWDKLEVVGQAARSRASRVVSCLDKCSLDADCRMGELKKKEMKKYQKCITDCKIAKCQEEPECKAYFEAYANCKGEVARSPKCDALATGEKAALEEAAEKVEL
eukprot:TRINITY_DN14255_c0_g1_i1.p1 TRINITY_DN14255_c0_g1~~TRINITY_DN14255_c0_g1_i1.p1  ORF type:complete len:245 (-),score=73.45 TRINITY_DN14255_c0_g1_i1:66-800(-)